MTGYRCLDTGKVYLKHPPGHVCSGERSGERLGERVEAVTLSGNGTVYSHTTLHTAAEPFEKDLPFQIALIELDEGPRLTARVDGGAVAIGDAVRLRAQRDGICFFAKR